MPSLGSVSSQASDHTLLWAKWLRYGLHHFVSHHPWPYCQCIPGFLPSNTQESKFFPSEKGLWINLKLILHPLDWMKVVTRDLTKERLVLGDVAVKKGAQQHLQAEKKRSLLLERREGEKESSVSHQLSASSCIIISRIYVVSTRKIYVTPSWHTCLSRPVSQECCKLYGLWPK